MAPLFRLLALCLLLNLSLPAVSAEQVSKDDLDAQKELLQLKIDSGKESVQKDIEAQGKRIEDVGKRVDDLQNRFGGVDTFLTGLSMVIGFVSVFLGIFGYFSVASRAKETSEEIAEKTTQKWFADNQRKLLAEIEQAQSTAQQQAQAAINALQQAGKLHEQEMADLRALKKSAEDELAELFSYIQHAKSNATIKSRQLEELFQRLQTTWAGTDNAGSDHEHLGPLGEKQSAIALHGRDSDLETSEQIARAMITKGIKQGLQGMLAEEVNIYEQVIEQYSADPHPEIREFIARAMFYKGNAVKKQGRLLEALKIFEQVIALYDNDTRPETRLQVACSMAQKGITLGHLDQPKETLKVFEQVISRYINDALPRTHDLVTLTMQSKAFALLLDTKAQLVANPAAHILPALNEAQSLLQQALERKPNWGMALGNLAYVQWLLQQPAAAESSFRQALLSKEDGGEALYRATLDDIAQHPIPADQGFRELVDRLWAEYQNQASGPATG